MTDGQRPKSGTTYRIAKFNNNAPANLAKWKSAKIDNHKLVFSMDADGTVNGTVGSVSGMTLIIR